MDYYITKKLNTNFEEAKTRVIDSLSKEGFGILTEIDVQKTLKNKIDVDFYRYTILGACNPQMAYQALQAEDKIGVMLPCNVIIQQKNPKGPVEIAAVDPIASMQAIKNSHLVDIAKQARSKLISAMEQISINE